MQYTHMVNYLLEQVGKDLVHAEYLLPVLGQVAHKPRHEEVSGKKNVSESRYFGYSPANFQL